MELRVQTQIKSGHKYFTNSLTTCDMDIHLQYDTVFDKRYTVVI